MNSHRRKTVYESQIILYNTAVQCTTFTSYYDDAIVCADIKI